VKSTQLAGLLLLPALAAVVAGAAGAADPAAGEAALGGWVCLGLAPMALALVARPPAWNRSASALVAVLLALALVSGLTAASGDGFERDRALILSTCAALAALAAAALDESGRLALVRGCVAVALVAAATDLAGLPSTAGGFAQNTGELSGALLPGALCGVALACTGRGVWRWAGGLAALLWWTHAVRTPVTAALVTGSIVLVGASLLALRGRRRHAPGLGLAATLCLAATAFQVAGGLAEQRAAADATPATQVPGDTGGVEVRARIWKRTAAMSLERPLLGAGPGQFAVRFPLHRDPLEIELSSHGRRQEQEREVEHPHSDLLLLAAELGLPAAAVWLVLACAVAAATVRSLRSGDEPDRALALGGAGVLVAGLFNATLFYNPVASVLGFSLVGALLARPPRPPGAGSRAPLRIGGLLLLLLACRPALGLVRHGLALASIAPPPAPTAAAVESALERALSARPDSAVALSLRARLLEQTGAEGDAILDAWDEVLALRPHRVEPLLQSGVHHARRGDVEQARERFAATLVVDPGHPGALRNRAWLELSTGDLERGLAALEAARAAGHADGVWLSERGAELLLSGREDEGLATLALAHERFGDLTGETAWALSREYRTKDAAVVADALESRAHRLWAREHAADRRWDDAYRSLRQVLRITRRYVPGGPEPVRLELGAALWHARMPAEAREAVAGIRDPLRLSDRLPTWVAEALAGM
jgi:O-antigen ligase